MLHPMIVPLLAVVSIHLIWRGYQFWLKRREQMLRERVAYMLWVAANH